MVADPGQQPPSGWRILLLVFIGAVAGALGLRAAGVPGGLVLGGTIGATAVVMIRNREVQLPSTLITTIQLLVGLTVGIRFTPETLGVIGPSLVPAITVSLLLVASGVAIARLLYRFGMAPAWILLATSPGGLEAVVSIAVERGDGPVEVGLFHFVRILLVLLSIPLLLLVLG